MNLSQEELTLLQQAEKRLKQLSPERLRVANDFLAYWQEREENEATEELLSIPGFEAEFQEALQEADSGEVVSFKAIRRDVWIEIQKLYERVDTALTRRLNQCFDKLMQDP